MRKAITLVGLIFCISMILPIKHCKMEVEAGCGVTKEKHYQYSTYCRYMLSYAYLLYRYVLA